jgi:hypothetical protein
MSGRRPWLGVAAWLLSLGAGLALWSAPAPAATTRQQLPFSPFGSGEKLTGAAVDQASGNVLAADSDLNRVLVYGAEGGSPAGGIPAELKGEETPAGFFEFGGEPVGVAVDPSNGDIYVTDVTDNVVDMFRVNGTHKYEYICQFTGYGFAGDACLKNEPSVEGTPSEVTFKEPVGVAVDREGNVYIVDYGHNDVDEFNAAGEEVRRIPVPEEPQDVAVDSTGDLYVREYASRGRPSSEVELKRSSLTGAVDSEANPHKGTTGVAFDRATGRLLVGFGTYVEEYDEAGESEGSFGSKALSEARGIAIDEATNDVYVVNGESRQVDAFGSPIILASVTTGSPSDVLKNTATVSGVVDPEGAGEAHYFFQYGTSTAYGLETPEEGTTVEMHAGAVLKELEPETTYHYRLVAGNANGTNYGEDETFTTQSAVTVGPCLAQYPSQATSATICGSIDPEGLETSFHFQYGTGTEYGLETPEESAGLGTEAHEFTASISGLEPSVTYHYRLVTGNELGTTVGPEQSFTTPVAVPTVDDQTPYATEVALHEATLHGTIDPGNGITEYHFVYGPAAGAYTQSGPIAYTPLNYEEDQVSQLVMDLEPGRVYHYALVATNESGTSTGPDETFSTISSASPAAQTGGENEEPTPAAAANPLNAPLAPLLVPTPPFPAVEVNVAKLKGEVRKHKRTRRKRATRKRTGGRRSRAAGSSQGSQSKGRRAR